MDYYSYFAVFHLSQGFRVWLPCYKWGTTLNARFIASKIIGTHDATYGHNFVYLFCVKLQLACLKRAFLFPVFHFRGHNSTGDLKLLDRSSPLFSSSSLPGDPELQGFRRRASTFSHSPTSSSVLEYSPLQNLPHEGQDPAAATKPKLVRHYSVSTDSPHQSKWGEFLFI